MLAGSSSAISTSPSRGALLSGLPGPTPNSSGGLTSATFTSLPSAADCCWVARRDADEGLPVGREAGWAGWGCCCCV